LKIRIEKIVPVGFSEGAMTLPLVYKKINCSGNVLGMAPIAFGGLSVYESYAMLSKWI
jgi:hypothetical protein